MAAVAYRLRTPNRAPLRHFPPHTWATFCHKLLKKYHEKAIINALNSYKGKRIYSLRVKFLEPIIEAEQKKIDKINSKEIKEIEYKDTTLEKPRKPFGKKSRLSELEDFDNE